MVTGSEMRDLDQWTMQDFGMPGEMLMENAGRAAAGRMLTRLTLDERVIVLCGSGNNGGDGFVIARCLYEAGICPEVWLIPEENRLSGEAKFHYGLLLQCGIQVNSVQAGGKRCEDVIAAADVVIDAMLGTGVSGELREPYASLVAACNETAARVEAVDIPSGLPADEGVMWHTAVQADFTVVLAAYKESSFLPRTAPFYGEIEVVSIGLPPGTYDLLKYERRLWQRVDVQTTLPVRSAEDYKSTYGKGLIVGGSETMPGAPLLAGEAALKSGTGLLTLALPASFTSAAASRLPEAMLQPFSEGVRLSADVTKFDAAACGPGLGRDEAAAHLVQHLIYKTDGVLILDADALHILRPSELKSRRKPTVLTPHAGELAALTGLSVEEVLQAPFQTSFNFATAYGVYVVMKGAHTITSTPDGRQFVNPTGNAVLARGGTGDVLTGMVLAFTMSHTTLDAAVANAVYLHGAAADALAVTVPPHAVKTSDVISALPLAFQSVESTD
ncbi:NAD(P)H-hydrate dehydratase [Salsuginibacillus halophilus]|uniref:NAD(P)H-hydrate dehydratase n=1 Tax=Salsuginibacillus halophilus TaxID=517424 RepID=UPI001FEA5278|nr:NAD(P)H-hydrate dehydratase [Salsuginibacillus halophilus]